MKIGICDDETYIAELLEDMIKAAFENRNVALTITKYNIPAEMFQKCKEYDAVFIDIDMPEMDGIELAKNIMRENPECVVIMATGKNDRYRDAIHIKVADYILKPYRQADIDEAVSLILNEHIGEDEIEVYYQREIYKIRERDIIYIEAFNGYVLVNTATTIFRKDISLLKLMDIIENKLFVQISRKVIVNMLWIEKYICGNIYINGKKLEIVRPRKKSFEKKYIEFDLEYRRFK